MGRCAGHYDKDGLGAMFFQPRSVWFKAMRAPIVKANGLMTICAEDAVSGWPASPPQLGVILSTGTAGKFPFCSTISHYVVKLKKFYFSLSTTSTSTAIMIDGVCPNLCIVFPSAGIVPFYIPLNPLSHAIRNIFLLIFGSFRPGLRTVFSHFLFLYLVPLWVGSNLLHPNPRGLSARFSVPFQKLSMPNWIGHNFFPPPSPRPILVHGDSVSYAVE